MIGFGGDPGFDVTFSIMRIMVPVIFVLVFGIIIVAMVRGIGEWNKNNHSPKLSVPAKVVSRRTAVSHHHHHQGKWDVSYPYRYQLFCHFSGRERRPDRVSGFRHGIWDAGGRRLRGADLSGYPLFEFSTERVGGMKGVTVKRSGGLKISRENERIPRIEHRVHA